MEFDDGDNKEKKSLQPPPMQNSKDYYNQTQRMTEAMIQNPQFQMFSIDEEDSIRSSMRDSEDSRKKKLDNDKKNDLDMTPHPGTPPNDAPEDAYRNIHRQYDGNQDDDVSKKIEDYQKQELARLANYQQMQQQKQ